MTPEEQTDRLRVLCERMKLAQTRMERERVLSDMAKVIREPISTFFTEG